MFYPVEFEKEEDGRWIAEVPHVPGALAYGKTKTEAKWHARAVALAAVVDRLESVEASHVTVGDERLTAELQDGRTISVPLAWYPRLANGTRAERRKLEIGPSGIHWPDLDEDISYKGLLLGYRSGESKTSFRRWLTYRARGEKVPVPTLPLPEDLKRELLRTRKPRAAGKSRRT